MKIGGENKTAVWALSILGVIAAYGIYSNFFSGPSSTPAPAQSARSKAVADAIPDSSAPPPPDADSKSAQRTNRVNVQEFRPKLRSKKKEEQIADISKVDPTIRMDWLKKVQEVPQAGGERDLFQILKAPPVHEVAQLKGEEVHVWKIWDQPRTPPPPPPPPVPPPPPPPLVIPLKYYGLCTNHTNGKRTAYFLDNEEIIEGVEGATLKGRYKVLRIGPTQVVMEDIQSKKQANLALEPEMGA
jgi:hypothetical protein